MTRAEQRKLLRALCNNMRDHLLAHSDRWPEGWDGHELRALVAREADSNLGCVRPKYVQWARGTPGYDRECRQRSKQFAEETYEVGL